MDADPSRATWIEEWARRIEASGLSSIVLLLLDGLRAFRYLWSQALLIGRPLLGDIADSETLERFALLFDQPELLERLATCLEKRGG